MDKSSETQFLASSYWRGAMNVGDMRLFDTLDKAMNYVISLPKHSFKSVSFVRIYELSPNKPPKLRTNEVAVYKAIEKAWGI